MAITKTIGGERVGSGNKMQTKLPNYGMSTHNLQQTFTSSAAPGVLYPFLKLVSQRGDTFDIDLDAACLTIPTQGPLFGSFKMQLDIYQAPWRLYQALLHNNPTALGLKMGDVMLPQLKFQTYAGNNLDINEGVFKNNSLMKYLGLSGIGTLNRTSEHNNLLQRSLQCIPMLAYYDIFKNYYANKQEENAYMIGWQDNNYYGELNKAIITAGKWYWEPGVEGDGQYELSVEVKKDPAGAITYQFESNKYKNFSVYIFGKDLDPANIYVDILYSDADEQGFEEDGYINNWTTAGKCLYTELGDRARIDFNCNVIDNNWDGINAITIELGAEKAIIERGYIGIRDFDLRNIDDMRMAILSKHQLGVPFVIREKGIGASQTGDWNEESGHDESGLPYMANIERRTYNNHSEMASKYVDMCGLMLKTYQSDIFNNWINTDWLEGENGIEEITKVAVSDGAFTIDALNLAEKLYNLLNRVAVAGNTYEDWLDVVYKESPKRHIESPVYLGGASYEVVFEQIVQNSPSDAGGEETALGTLGGKGKLIKRKGGHIHVRIDEPSYIIGIVSLTPRVVYTQGNDWDITELKSLDDLRKPGLDGIGFQDLIGEQMLSTDTAVSPDGTTLTRSKIGKLPAWINYMTAFDKAYGDFADVDGKAFMVLGRNYEATQTGKIKDATTYVDPSKYNYAFAYTELAAQNFWIQIDSKITKRGLGSAKMIPNI